MLQSGYMVGMIAASGLTAFADLVNRTTPQGMAEAANGADDDAETVLTI